jgi:hypothetical protein
MATCLGTGRPYVVAGRALAARTRRAGGHEGGWRAGVGAPEVAGLSADLRTRLAAAWARDAAFEHASIASFGRFALELLAVGAPADLVALAHAAALDEIEHTRLCLGLASAYRGEPMAPGPFPFEGSVEVSADLASMAARAVAEGCVGETLASLQAAEQLAAASDPAVRAVLTVIAEDEARHAEFAFRFVAWALAQGDPRVHAAVTCAFAERCAPGAAPPAQEGLAAVAFPEGMAAHGRLDPASLGPVIARALDEVVQPSARSLLAAGAESRPT